MMGSPVFYNKSLARFVHKPTIPTSDNPNQSIFYSNFVSEHIKLQEKYNETIKDYIKSNETFIKKLAAEQKELQGQFLKHEQNQKGREDKFTKRIMEQDDKFTQKIMEQDNKFTKKIIEQGDKFTKKIKEQKNLLEVFVGFMKKQEKHNETTAKQHVEHKEQLEILERIVKNQEIFNAKVSENISLVKEQFDQIISSLKNYELNSETLSKRFEEKNEKDEEVVATITEQKELFLKVLTGLKDNKEQYEILFDYVRNQDHFNHKLFEYLCSKFEEEENTVN